MSEAPCGGAQRNHTSVAGGDCTEGQKLPICSQVPRRQKPAPCRESPVRVNHTSVAGGDSTEGQKPLKSKNLSRRQVPLQSRESPVCVGARLYKTRNLRKAATHQDLKYLCQAGSPRFA